MKGNGIAKGVSSGIGAIVTIQTSLNKNTLTGGALCHFFPSCTLFVYVIVIFLMRLYAK